MRTMRAVNRSTNGTDGAEPELPPPGEPPLALRMEAEIALRSVPGRRVLLVAPPHPWLTDVVAARAGDLEVVTDLDPSAGDLSTRASSFETVIALRVVPFLGEDSKVSERRARLLVAAMAEKLVPGGTLVFDIDNPQSLRGAAYGVRHLAKAIEAGPLVVDTPEGPDRFDTLERFAADLPEFVDLVELHGVELVYAPAAPRALPVLGSLWTRIEWKMRSMPVLRRLASHLVLVLRHGGGRRTDRRS
ncbi:MAG: hypothetical protein D6705_05950 [Deltaproteobacteria bacterium]|nr:MAG: hypothetical protein D6705_05950 [Deltaproteobacteria bacterium]